MQEKDYAIEEEYEDIEEKQFVLDDEDVDVEEIMGEEDISSPQVISPLQKVKPAEKEDRTEQELDEQELEDLLNSIDNDFAEPGEEELEEKTNPLPPQKEISTVPEKPKYTGNYSLEMKLPKSALPDLLKVYCKKANAGKILDAILVEAYRIARRKIKKKSHLSLFGGKNIWVPLQDIFTKTYRDKRRLYESVALIAEILEGKFQYKFVMGEGEKSGRREYLVLNIANDLLERAGKKEYLKVIQYDYSLTNAELIFFRQLQATIGPGGFQYVNKTTMLKFGELAWHYLNNKKLAQRKTEECLKKLYHSRRIWMKEIKASVWEGEKYSLHIVDPTNEKEMEEMKYEWN